MTVLKTKNVHIYIDLCLSCSSALNLCVVFCECGVKSVYAAELCLGLKVRRRVRRGLASLRQPSLYRYIPPQSQGFTYGGGRSLCNRKFYNIKIGLFTFHQW